MGFGQHQSFYLRMNWLSKALKMIQEDNRFFFDENGFEKIGLGKNMAKSLKFWASATKVIVEEKDSEKKTYHSITRFGELFLRYDRFLRLPITASLQHFFLVSDKSVASTWYWFFNEWSKRYTTHEDLFEQLQRWADQNSKRPVSANSLKRDLDCLKLLYTVGLDQESDPEDVIASPFAKLGLVQEGKMSWSKKTPSLDDIDVDALFFVLLLYAAEYSISSFTLEELQYKPMLWGKVFHLSSNQILQAIEILEAQPQYSVKFIRTNQIYNLIIENQDPYTFLEEAYQRKVGF